MSSNTKKTIVINGQEKDTYAKTLHELIADLEILPGTVVAEVNGVIVPASQFEHGIAGGDIIELVRFVGGG